MRGTTCRPALWALISSLDSHRVAFSQSLTAALGTSLLALAHPSTLLAVLSAQRDAAAQALRHLGQLQRIGAPGATALAASLAIPTRGAFLSNAVLTSRISVEDQPGAIAVGLFPYGTCMAQLVRHLEEPDLASGEYPGGSPRPDAPRELRDLRDARFAYPLALGAVVRACSPAAPLPTSPAPSPVKTAAAPTRSPGWPGVAPSGHRTPPTSSSDCRAILARPAPPSPPSSPARAWRCPAAS